MSEEPKEGDKPKEYTLKVNRREVAVDEAEMIRRAQLGTASEELAQQRKDFKQDRSNGAMFDAMVEAAQKDPALGTRLDAFYNEVVNGIPAPSASAPTGDPVGEGGAGSPPMHTGRPPAAPTSAQEARIQQLEERLNTRDHADLRGARDAALAEAVGRVPRFAEGQDPGSRELVATFARTEMATNPDLSVDDAVLSADASVRERLEEDAENRRTVLERRQTFTVPPGGEGSPFLPPETPPTYKDLEDGSLLKTLKEKVSKAANPTV